MSRKKIILICAGALACVVLIALIALGVTTPASTTTEVLTLDELREMNDVSDENYLPCVNLLRILDGAQENLELSGPPTFGKVYITRSHYVLAADRMTLSVPIASQYAPAGGASWLFEFRVLSMEWNGSELVETAPPAVERLTLEAATDPNVNLGYSGRNPDAIPGTSGTISQKQMLIGDNGEYQFLCSVSRSPANSEPTRALWSVELVMRQGLSRQRFQFSLSCVTDYSDQ